MKKLSWCPKEEEWVKLDRVKELKFVEATGS